ncbi:ATP synthase subunit I [Dehalobacter sp. DCM]|uniref:ATP synthase subunit I n=1 Tax=Dehalobacter sp. DCM TaxID=2907827 RepID=UPI003081B1E0|nr:ATP synthase subunit I [Dehalobacter sp. DCM]
MSKRVFTILAGYVSSATLLVVYFTDKYQILGILIGFLTGLINIQWLFRDSRKVIDKDINGALRTYYLSLFSRLGMITMVVAIIFRFKPEWLPYFAGGIAAGILIPLSIALIQQRIHGRG